MNRIVGPLTAAVAVGACVAHPRPPVASNYQVIGLFPQTEYALRTRAILDGVVPPDPAAPACGPAAAPDASWVRMEETVPTRRLRNLSLLVPSDFRHQTIDGVEERRGRAWGHILGEWSVPRRAPVGRDAGPNFTLWIGSERGFGTVGTSPTTVQRDAKECKVTGDPYQLHLLRFVLSGGVEDRYYLSASWRVRSGVWVMALGSAPDSAGQNQLEAIARSLRFTAR